LREENLIAPNPNAADIYSYYDTPMGEVTVFTDRTIDSNLTTLYFSNEANNEHRGYFSWSLDNSRKPPFTLGKIMVTQAISEILSPIQINHYLNQYFPEWREPSEDGRAKWLNDAVDRIAKEVMVNINKAAAVNAKNLIGSALLASRQRALTREQLIEQVESYMQLFRNVPYSEDMTLPTDSAEAMLEHVLKLPRSGVTAEKDNFGELIRLDRESAVLMTYYRNNIQHFFVLPSLVASVILHLEAVSKDLIVKTVQQIYPFLKAELFLRFNETELRTQIELILNEFTRQQLVKSESEVFKINPAHLRSLQLHSNGVRELLQRYFIGLNILLDRPEISRGELEKESRSIAQRLSVLHGINAPEFFDKALFSTFTSALKVEGYFDSEGKANKAKIEAIEDLISSLISAEIKMTISSAVKSIE